MLRNLTPLVLTLNEEANLDRTLANLHWADQVVVLDSGSSDGTKQIAARYNNTSWHYRPFDSLGRQWDHGVNHCGIATPYVLTLDADMLVTNTFLTEYKAAFATGSFAAGITPFEYHLSGQRLLGSLYPPKIRVLKRGECRIFDEGHKEVFETSGERYHFRSKLIHDDRKPLDRWLGSQLKYAQIESEWIREGHGEGLKTISRLRGVSPLLAGALAYLRAGGPLCRGSRRYAMERTVFECLLCLQLGEKRDRPKQEHGHPPENKPLANPPRS